MKIRIQPSEIEIHENDPFKYDQLGRKEPAEILTHLVGSIEGPCVLAIEAPWGTGKTTFLKMWSQYLRQDKQGFPVIEFNAWETDFSGNPFQALSAELTGGLEKYTDDPAPSKIAEFKKTTGKIFKQTFLNSVKAFTSGIVDIDRLKEQDPITYAEKKLSEYEEEQESVQSFRKALEDIAKDLSESKKNRPLVVVIDELDRCRPPYAVELLEIAKHLFAVDNVVFVLAINRVELENSIKALYGNDFDSKGYLRRFFDIDFRLPDPERKAFIRTKLEEIKLSEYFDRTQDLEGKSELETVQNMLLSFFGSPRISLRNVSQALHRLGLVFASLRSDRKSFARAAVVALILRTVDPELYDKLVLGEVSDKEVVDSVYDQLGKGNLTSGKILFESVIILGPKEETILRGQTSDEIDSPLLNHYKERLAQIKESDNTFKNLNQYLNHVTGLIEYVDSVRQNISNLGQGELGWKYTVRRLELITPDLVNERESEKQEPL